MKYARREKAAVAKREADVIQEAAAAAKQIEAEQAAAKEERGKSQTRHTKSKPGTRARGSAN